MGARDHDDVQPRAVLAGIVAAAQRRWGVRALAHGVGRMAAPPSLPTGLAPLDTLLDGGLPRGRLTEYLGTPTSGMATIALTTLAHTQAKGEIGAYLDLRATFDVGYAAACGVDLAALLLVRPKGLDDALELTEALLTSGSVGLLVIDALSLLRATNDAAVLAPALQRLLPAIAWHPGALLILSPLRAVRSPASVLDLHTPFVHAAALRLHIMRLEWSLVRDTPTCSVRLTVVKRHGGTDGQTVETPLAFPSDWGRL